MNRVHRETILGQYAIEERLLSRTNIDITNCLVITHLNSSSFRGLTSRAQRPFVISFQNPQDLMAGRIPTRSPTFTPPNLSHRPRCCRRDSPPPLPFQTGLLPKSDSAPGVEQRPHKPPKHRAFCIRPYRPISRCTSCS
jgi:hypothetical protein